MFLLHWIVNDTLSVGDTVFITLDRKQYCALEEDIIYISQGCLLNKYPLGHSSEQRTLEMLNTQSGAKVGLQL